MPYSNIQLKKIESAAIFAAAQFSKYSKNPKPALLHSMKVGVKLMEYDMPYEVVIAGFLHDLLEDTKCTKKMIQKKFGQKVAKYVSAMTMDYKYKDFKIRWHDAFKRLRKIGKYALLLKLVDSADNLPYFSKKIEPVEAKKLMLWKANFVLGNCQKVWGGLKIYRDYKSLYTKILLSLKVSNESEYFRH